MGNDFDARGRHGSGREVKSAIEIFMSREAWIHSGPAEKVEGEFRLWKQ